MTIENLNHLNDLDPKSTEVINPSVLLELLDHPDTIATAVELAHRIGLINGSYRPGTNPLQVAEELHARLQARIPRKPR